MTVPNTPPDPARADGVTDAVPAPYAADRDPYAAPGPASEPYGLPPGVDLTAGKGRSAEPIAQRLLPELRVGAATVLACLVLGVVMGALWVWLAPKVPLVVDGNKILYADPEGEQRAGADSVFVLLGLGAGLLTALGAFLFTRKRGGGIAVAVGLAVGGLLASVGAWGLGRWLGPSRDLVAQARRVGNGGHFSADIDLGAYGAVLAWPMAAMVLLLALSAAFGKREEDPPPYWVPGPPVPGAGLPAGQPGVHPAVHPAAPPQDRREDRREG
ncbi:hypothetical protein [Streptomyces sp. NRRL S-495]|uniref:hypothetical protein n=1 Tax=Streptomyces sp. NRRL S-495 TaxID=1609133 RepID=UPI0007C6E04E|nr:hypothetical protein [Streptomyces sp. NRRL S-495]